MKSWQKSIRLLTTLLIIIIFEKKGKNMGQPVEASLSGSDAVTIPSSPEKVSFNTVSFFRSHWFALLGSTVALAANVVWILPVAASLLDKTVSPQLFRVLLGTLVVGAVYLGSRIKKELVYEISLLYTIQGSKAWWNKINDNIFLGAIPLDHQKDRIKNLGVTHVISTLEPFELKRGLVRPIESAEWKEKNISHKHIEAVDFIGMPVHQIHEAVEYMHDEIQKKPAAKFYVHCKAGRGRSVTVVIAYLMKYGTEKFATKKEAYAFVKELRPQVNLNENQLAAIQAYIDKHVKV